MTSTRTAPNKDSIFNSKVTNLIPYRISRNLCCSDQPLATLACGFMGSRRYDVCRSEVEYVSGRVVERKGGQTFWKVVLGFCMLLQCKSGVHLALQSKWPSGRNQGGFTCWMTGAEFNFTLHSKWRSRRLYGCFTCLSNWEFGSCLLRSRFLNCCNITALANRF